MVIHGICSNCGSATGVIKIKSKKLFGPIRKEKRCSDCNPELFLTNKNTRRVTP